MALSFVPIGGRFMDESSRHETREREDRERSPRSPTHQGDATAALASSQVESLYDRTVSVCDGDSDGLWL